LYHIAPILLMFELEVAALTTGLADYMASSSDMARAYGPFEGAVIGSIVYLGIGFSLEVKGTPPNFHPENRVFCDSESTRLTSVLSIELGDNVKGGELIAPIIKALLSLSRKIGTAIGATAVYWRPADIISSFAYFDEAVGGYEGGGIFPVLALVHFDLNTAGLISSKGLFFLTEQEIAFTLGRLTPEEAMRRIVSVVHDLATNGPVVAALTLPGLDESEQLYLEPDRSGRVLTIQITSKMDQ
jgi:hypothetical protein